MLFAHSKFMILLNMMLETAENRQVLALDFPVLSF